ncbi:MAG: hypothetical protein KIT18_00525 [Burkholderiales bacterium]|nr:hypothetical protein [Burkholderiales bacterium]
MSQQINLFDPALRKQRYALSLMTVVQCVAVTLLALTGYHYYLSQQVKGLNTELAAAQTLLGNQRMHTERLKTEGAGQMSEGALDAEIARLDAELQAAKDTLGALKGGILGNQDGFAEYMRAFSRQALNGLWLTGFSIGGAGDIAIAGRVTSPDLVAGYIQRLNQEKVLQGRTFSALEMHAPAAPADADKDKPAAGPHFLEFSLGTTEPAASGGGRQP